MTIKQFIFTIGFGFLIVIAIMNNSINAYIEQKYHIKLFDSNSEPFASLAIPSVWIESIRSSIFPSQEDLQIESSLESNEENIEIEEATTITYPYIDESNNIVLLEHSTILLIGDSMMQGVGLTLVSELKKLGFKVINLAKQSTGLTYPSFFDWNKTLKDTFIKNPNIDLVVVMVGANDPYHMPKKPFKSPEWTETYTQRVKDILTTSIDSKAVVAWYQAPIVKKEPLNSKMAFLNEIYEKEVLDSKQIFLYSNDVLAPEGKYTAFIKNEKDKSVRLRANDGIHFATQGSKLLGKLLIDRLEIVKLEPIEEDEVKENTENETHIDNKENESSNMVAKENEESNTQSDEELFNELKKIWND